MATNIKQDTLNGLRWRCIGPPRGARSIAVAGDPASPAVFYFGACAGGVWKTYDGGTYWENVSDGYFKTSAVGAIAVAESDPNVVYVGMGEACVRVDGSYGDGVYRSTDAGKTWINVGLQDTRHISRVRVHPDNPDLVYVAALGHAFGPHPDRGVFRSTDGGGTWEKVLATGNEAGAIDLSMDSRQSQAALRRRVADAPTVLGYRERRTRQRAVSLCRWRRHVGRRVAEPGLPRRTARAYRRRGLTHHARPLMGNRGGTRARPLPLR